MRHVPNLPHSWLVKESVQSEWSGELYPAYHNNGTRHNSDDTMYLGDGFNFIIRYQGSSSCSGFGPSDFTLLNVYDGWVDATKHSPVRSPEGYVSSSKTFSPNSIELHKTTLFAADRWVGTLDGLGDLLKVEKKEYHWWADSEERPIWQNGTKKPSKS